MNEILGMLRDAIGIKPLIPVLLIVLLGMAFLTVRRYPTHELIYDRWFLVSVIVVVCGSLAYAILSSGLAERTPSGRVGVYLARLKNDPDRSAHLRLLESIQANMELKARSAGFQVEFRDLQREVNEEDPTSLLTLSSNLNAAVIVWGTVTDGATFFPRVWSAARGLNRSSQPIDTRDLAQTGVLSEDIWRHVSRFAQAQAEKKYRSLEDVQADIRALQGEVAELRTALRAMGSATGAPATFLPTSGVAILVGVSEYKEAAPLIGPKNDVLALENALQKRGTSWAITKLVDNDASSAKVKEAIDKALSTLGADDVLVLYFSGHVSRSDRGTVFYFIDLNDNLLLAELFRDVLKRHEKTLFIVDSGFDVHELTASELSNAALMTADVTGRGIAIEQKIGNTYYGAFTAALTKVLSDSTPGIALRAPDLFSATDAVLKGWNIEGPTAGIIYGSDPPAL